jgi:acetyl-CoA carboxylase carboxyl transferase subunit alpha
MGLIAPRLKELELIDEIIEEPLGGAHRDHLQMAQNMKDTLVRQLEELEQFDNDTLLERRYQRLMSYGYC